jgi:hypothetical protein
LETKNASKQSQAQKAKHKTGYGLFRDLTTTPKRGGIKGDPKIWVCGL